LDIETNGLSNLDLKSNLKIISVNCRGNLLNSLELDDNSLLERLYCSNNEIEYLNLSKLTSLKRFTCHNNKVKQLDFSNSKKLESIGCQSNKLEYLNVKNGTNSRITQLSASSNSLLSCIQVDNEQAANAGIGNYSGWSKDAFAIYSEDCGATAGIDDEILTEGLNLYPNPASNRLSIQSKLPLEKVEIYSILGKKVKDIESGFNSISLDNLSKGIYILRIHSENGTTVRKLIKE
jgi:hypothetical protein